MKTYECVVPFLASIDDGLTNTAFNIGEVSLPDWLAKVAIREKWVKPLKTKTGKK